jgi:hypothetical protein
MKKLVTSMVVMAAALGSAPALAQYHDGYHGSYQGGGYGAGGWNRDSFWRGAPAGVWERIRFLQDRIDRGIANGSLDRREGRRASNELNRIRDWVAKDRQRHYGRIDPGTEAQVQDRLDRLSQSIRWMRHNGW